jgi:hypothetical protein
MSALHDTTTSTQALGSPDFRRMLSPWAYKHARGLAAVHFTVAVFLLGVFVMLIARSLDGWATLPVLGAALNFAIGRAYRTAARSATSRA